MRQDIRNWIAACGVACSVAGGAQAAEGNAVKREIIPGSELMTAQEREQYRVRMRGAKSDDDRDRLRGEHVKQIRERARVRGLEVRDHASGRSAAERSLK